MDTSKISERFNSAAEEYDRQRRFFIPNFDLFYGSGIDFLVNAGYSFSRILDLGAGTGLLSKYLYTAYPGAHFTLVDVADKMLEVARLRFEAMGNIEYIVSDYSHELPGGKFGLVASGLSIHHLENDVKAVLYRNVYDRLESGGCLLNIDQFNASSVCMNDEYNRQWYGFIKQGGIPQVHEDSWRERRELDRENTIEETLDMLRAAGFRAAECIYSYMKFGVVVAVR